MARAARQLADHSVTRTLAPSDLTIVNDDGEVRLRTPKTPAVNPGARLTYHAFGQLASLAGAPASYLRTLPAANVAADLGYGFKVRAHDTSARLQVLAQHDQASSPDTIVRAVNGKDYSRVWTADMLDYLTKAAESLPPGVLVTPPAWTSADWTGNTRAATAADVGPWTRVQLGDTIRPAGLYYGPSSGRDTFVLMIDTRAVIKGPDGAAKYRFLMLWNSETGAATIGGALGLVDIVCGNHILWGVRDVTEFRFRHVGQSVERRAVRELESTLSKLDTGSDWETRALKAASNHILGDTIEKALQAAAGRTKLPMATLQAGAQLAEVSARYGDPRSAYSVASGLTELSQQQPHFEDRTDLDRAAGKLYACAL